MYLALNAVAHTTNGTHETHRLIILAQPPSVAIGRLAVERIRRRLFRLAQRPAQILVVLCIAQQGSNFADQQTAGATVHGINVRTSDVRHVAVDDRLHQTLTTESMQALAENRTLAGRHRRKAHGTLDGSGAAGYRACRLQPHEFVEKWRSAGTLRQAHFTFSSSWIVSESAHGTAPFSWLSIFFWLFRGRGAGIVGLGCTFSRCNARVQHHIFFNRYRRIF